MNENTIIPPEVHRKIKQPIKDQTSIQDSIQQPAPDSVQEPDSKKTNEEIKFNLDINDLGDQEKSSDQNESFLPKKNDEQKRSSYA